MRSFSLIVAAGIVAGSMVVGCAPPKGQTPLEKRANVLEMQDKTLEALYMRYPSAREEIAKSYGYAVLSRDDIMIYFVGFGGGYGVATEKGTGKQTFIKDAHASLGLGGGLRDSRGVLIFNTQNAFSEFVAGSWDVGAQAEIGFASRDRGFEQSAEVTFLSQTKYYQFTDAGDIIVADLPLYHVTPFDDLNGGGMPAAAR